MQYWWFLAGLSALFVVLERLWPWRLEQRVLRAGIVNDAFYLVFNGHFFSLLLALVAMPLWSQVDRLAAAGGLADVRAAAPWPLWLQTLVAVVVIDFVEWGVHNLLHRVGPLWRFHQVHHSIVELDWIGVMRFHWVEILVYKSLRYLPLLLLGFSWQALMIQAVFATAVGHFNHSNLRWRIGPLGYLLNNPRMHIWHHNAEPGRPVQINFGISLSLWDWVFGTAHVPDRPPTIVGLPDDQMPPAALWRQLIWPLRLGR